MMSPSISIISFVVDDMVSGKVVEIASDVVIVLDDMVSVNVVELVLIKEGVVTDGIGKGVEIISYDVDMAKDDIIVKLNISGLKEVDNTAEGILEGVNVV